MGFMGCSGLCMGGGLDTPAMNVGDGDCHGRSATGPLHMEPQPD